ncbi:MAG: hypothetical protein IKH12_01640 [Clostridia bacterium]|jgi:DNA-directed RNA polymerase subunit RPC12/RpoP|nr:hypothetical protein [Clostridia bacterium]
MATILDYKCPHCGGKLEFQPGTEQLQCPYCDSTVDVAALQQLDEVLKNTPEDNMQWKEAAGDEWSAAEQAQMQVYVCKSCGGEIMCDENTAATSCPFCGNPVVLGGRVSGTLKPDFVIPFQLDKKAAKDALKKHLEGKRLLPKVFKSENHIDEIKGVYVPFWLFDAEADADLRFKATKTRMWSDSKYNYTETSFFDVHRAGTLDFANVPVDGSKKMADDLMESIEPFDFSKAVDFQTAYLSGFLADKYDVGAEESKLHANERIKQSAESAMRGTVDGYATVALENSSVQFRNGKAKYALYPVWLLNTTWRGQQYTFAMNGQTGKFVGDLPYDKGQFWKYIAMFTPIYGAVAFGILWLLRNLF